MSFANFVPKWCCLPDNLTAIQEEHCREEDQLNSSMFGKMCQVNETSCSRRVFATGARTFVYEWDLVCERKWMVPITTSIQMAGLLVGGLLAGQMSDLLGRKKTLYFFTATTAVFCFLAAFSTSWEIFVSAIFLIGTSLGGYLAAAVPYTTEFVLLSSRTIASILPSFNIGVCLMALAAWRLPHWSTLYWMCGVMITPLLLPYFFLPESLRWLTVKGRVDEAQQVVEWIARWNKQEVPKDSLEVIKAVAEAVKMSEKTTNYTYIHIYKGWGLFKSSVIIQYIWLALSMCSYGFAFGVSSFGSNLYLNIFLMQVLSIPGVFAVTYSTSKGLGYGAANVYSRVGAILAPFLLNFEEGPTLALAMVGGSLLLAACAVCFLQETAGKALAESITVAGKTTINQLETEAPKINIFVIEKAANTNNVRDDVGDAPSKNDINVARHRRFTAYFQQPEPDQTYSDVGSHCERLSFSKYSLHIIYISYTNNVIRIHVFIYKLSFANFVPKWCCLPDNVTATAEEHCREEDQLNSSMFGKMCQLNETSCSRRVFATGARTVVYEWDLVCERKWMVPTTTSILMAGLLVGGLVKKTVYFFTATSAVFCFFAAFSTSWQMFASAIFLIGASLGGYFASAVPYTTEFVLPSSRVIVSMLPSFNFGVCLMALAAWRLPDWSMLYWICGILITLLLPPYFFLPESLRWLTVKGRVDEAQQVVEWIAHWNKQEVPKDSLEVIK
ncbi:unnamed protein product, partial [Candidula unifasciata]